MERLAVLAEMEAKGEELHVPLGLANNAQYSGKTLVTDSRVPGRLLGKQAVYIEIGAEPYVVEVISSGYKLEFDMEPPASFTQNNKSAREDPAFVRAELGRLEELGCIEKVQQRPYIVLPLSKVFSGKMRLVVDASRGLNPYCTSHGVKLEDLSHVSRTVKEGDHLVVNDLDSGYWHVPIARSHQKYLGVAFKEEDGSHSFWQWKVLCLGIKDAAHLFTRLIKPIMAELRRRGYKGLIYIDDSLTVSDTFDSCLRREEEAKSLFKQGGWVFKPSKRSGDPSQVCRFLGLVIDTRDCTFNVPEEKLVKIEAGCKELLRSKKVKARRLAAVLGLLQSVRPATGPILSILTRSSYAAVQDAARWESYVKLDVLARTEIEWWQENIRGVSKYSFTGKLSSLVADFQVASDGSGIGHFTYLVDGVRLAGRAFSAWEREQSSTYRELASFNETWTNIAVLEQFRGRKVTHFTDSKAMCAIIEKGSRNRILQPMILRAVLALREYSVEVEAIWRSRDEGVIRLADVGSRDYHRDDVSMDFDTFSHVVEMFGVPDVDCFASTFNKKAPKFFTRLDVLGSSGVDFFLQRLEVEDFHWVFPPPSKLCEAVWHLKVQGVEGAVVVPVWAGSSFYSCFWPDGQHCAKWVQDMLLVQPHYVCGPLVRSSAFKGRRSFLTAVLKVSFLGFEGRSFYEPAYERRLCLQGGCGACC